jgi:hypothetical protein
MTKREGQIATAVVIAAAALVLHGYVHFVRIEGFPIWAFFWSLVPYFLCFIVFLRSDSGIPSIAGGIVVLILDSLTLDEVFVHATSSASALLILVVPLWSTLFVVPVTILVTRLVMNTEVQQHARPTQVTRAVWLLWIGSVVAVTGAVPMYLEPSLPSPLDTAVPPWAIWVFLASLFGFWALLTFAIAQRRNWARVTTLVLFGGRLLLYVWKPEEMIASRPAYELVLDLLDAALIGLALYWLFTGSGAAWFRRPGASNAL